MGLMRGWGRLLRADPKLEWIRQHDSEAARQRLVWAAIVSLVLTPFFVLPGRSQSLTSAIYLSLITDLFSCLVFLALLLATALNLTRKSVIERPYVEVFAWILIGIALSQLGYSFAFQKIGSALIDPAAPPTSYGDMTNIADRDKAATVAFIMACISGLWLILST
jgi:hypothetical protein